MRPDFFGDLYLPRNISPEHSSDKKTSLEGKWQRLKRRGRSDVTPLIKMAYGQFPICNYLPFADSLPTIFEKMMNLLPESGRKLLQENLPNPDSIKLPKY